MGMPDTLHNINGTDFLPYIIDDYISKVGKDKVKLVIYGSQKGFQPQIRKYIYDNFGIELLYISDGYSDFDWSKLPKINLDNIYIFIVARGTPLQEIWSYTHRDKLNGFIVMNQGGTMDFWA